MSDDGILETRSSSGWLLPVVVVLGLVALAGLLIGWRANAHLTDTEQAVTAQVTSMKQSVEQDVGTLKDRLAAAEKSNGELQSDLGVVTRKLSITQGQLRKAREEAAQIKQDAADKLTALDTSVHTELATKAGADELKGVDTKVGVVRTDLDATREDLKMARSEMGTLIARNHEDIETLRRLGERDYVEFTLAGRNKPQKVGNVTVELKGTNPKKALYSIALTIEDKRFDKKNRAANEPIFFYTTGAHQPEEVVINKVSKDQVSGYLSVPKAGVQPSAPSANSTGGQ